MAIAVKPFSEDMAGGVIDLILPIQQDEFGVAISLADQPDLSDIPGFYQHGAGGFWVAIDDQSDGKVIGTIALIDIGSGAAALRKMFLGADYRGGGRGIAAKLLATLIDHGRAQGLTQIILGTTPMMAGAHRFYEKNGFQEIDESDLPQAFPVMAVDKRFYRLTL